MAEIKLTPKGQLCWVSENGESPAAFALLQKAFEHDWRQGMFMLAAEKVDVAGSASLRYIQTIAVRYLTGLCHIPESADTIAVTQPGGGEFSSWLLAAPPMTGAEYLSEDVLRTIWTQLDQWTQKNITSTGSLKLFLQTQAPKWHQIGRVCFHLAENKADHTYPFAFLATYSTGFGAAGKLKHLPLRTAIEQYAGMKNRNVLINLLSPVQQTRTRLYVFLSCYKQALEQAVKDLSQNRRYIGDELYKKYTGDLDHLNQEITAGRIRWLGKSAITD